VPVTLQSITFCHNVADPTSSALRIRRNAANPIPSPEWTNGGPGGFAGAPAAYASGLVTAPSVQVGLTGGTPGSELWVRASGGVLLGNAAATRVTFDANGSARATLALADHGLSGGPVARADETWTWQTSPDNRTWSWLATTQHRVYVTLALPQAPWMQGAAQGGPPLANEPWAQVLDWACTWAAGATGVQQAAQQITQALNTNAGVDPARRVGYERANGKSTYAAFGPFQCTAFLARLNGANPQLNFVNCADCASVVTTFANILGCALWESRMTPASSASGFPLNPVIGIGGDTFGPPFASGANAFAYHEVAWAGNAGDWDGVYDACLRVNNTQLGTTRTPDPAHAMPYLSTGEIFTDGIGYRTFRYREQLVKPATVNGQQAWDCAACPNTRERRGLM